MAEKDLLTPEERQQAQEQYRDAAQRYHDYFVKLHKENRLSEEDFPHYQRAMILEEKKLVQRLTPSAKVENE